MRFHVVTGGLLVGPAVNIALDSVRDPSGGFTLGNWGDFFRLPLTRRAIVNSLVLSGIVAKLCLVIGAPLAWSVSRLRVAGRSVAVAAIGVSANLPATSLVFGFAATFGSAGFVTLLLQRVWPATPALDLYDNTGRSRRWGDRRRRL